ncbi:glycosyltransferase family 4 protein [Dyadobacter bucti]|uniref:glycosyltransferase family 4 protein n=1 Tax=Dyadobacter bucti TaxID=2572203 RepID=UPI003F72D754
MVLHLSTFHLEGGAGVAATRLHRALLKYGTDSYMLVPTAQSHEEKVIELSDNKLQKKKHFGRFIAERLHFYPQEKDKTVRFAFSPAAIGADIAGHPLIQKADIIHLHWVNFGFLSLQSLESLFSMGKPVVWTLHDMWTFTGGCHYSRGCDNYLSHCQYCPYLAKPDQYDISFSQFEKKQFIYDQANLALVSPSRWLDGLVKAAALTKPHTSLTIPNCLDTTLFSPYKKLETRKMLGLPENKNLILFAGANTQDPRKGFAFFREAISQVGCVMENVEVLIFGKANPQNFSNFPVPVHYLGKITQPEEMVKAYNAANMIVVPSLEDNLPNTVMEALSCGVPAVGFSTGGVPEMIDHQVNGFVSDFGSAESLAEGIAWVLQNDGNNVISENARKKVLNSYSEKLIASQYQNLYASL